MALFTRSARAAISGSPPATPTQITRGRSRDGKAPIGPSSASAGWAPSAPRATASPTRDAPSSPRSPRKRTVMWKFPSGVQETGWTSRARSWVRAARYAPHVSGTGMATNVRMAMERKSVRYPERYSLPRVTWLTPPWGSRHKGGLMRAHRLLGPIVAVLALFAGLSQPAWASVTITTETAYTARLGNIPGVASLAVD